MSQSRLVKFGCTFLIRCASVDKRSIKDSYNDLLSTETLPIKKLKTNLNNKFGPEKGSRVTINILE